MKDYDRNTPVKILYEERKKRKSKDVRENIILSSGMIEDNKEKAPEKRCLFDTEKKPGITPQL